jgi:hypothetical protein
MSKSISRREFLKISALSSASIPFIMSNIKSHGLQSGDSNLPNVILFVYDASTLV